MIKADDIYPDCRVHTEENLYCVADCRVLNERKLAGCPTVVPGLLKYRLAGTTYVPPIPISSFSTRPIVSALKNWTFTYMGWTKTRNGMCRIFGKMKFERQRPSCIFSCGCIRHTWGDGSNHMLRL